MKYVYDAFIIFIIILKLTYVMSTLRMKLLEHDDSVDKKELEYIQLNNKKLLSFSEICMYIALLIAFFPSKKNVIISRREQEIFFILGILGIIHSDYSVFNLSNQ